MTTRVNDAVTPQCPNCRVYETRVINTSFTETREIVRRRRCTVCDHRWYTVQQAEALLNEKKWRVTYPASGSEKYYLKLVSLESYATPFD